MRELRLLPSSDDCFFPLSPLLLLTWKGLEVGVAEVGVAEVDGGLGVVFSTGREVGVAGVVDVYGCEFEEVSREGGGAVVATAMAGVTIMDVAKMRGVEVGVAEVGVAEMGGAEVGVAVLVTIGREAEVLTTAVVVR